MLYAGSAVHFSKRSLDLVASAAVLGLFLGFTLRLWSQNGPTAAANAAPAPDVIVFANGDRLTGKLLREVAGTVTFHSDIAGDVSVSWDKIKSIHTSQKFAVVQQGQLVTRKAANADIAQGVVVVENQQVELSAGAGGPTKEIPVKNAQFMIDEGTFDREVRKEPGFSYGWTGTLTLGAALVEATQNSRTFTSAANLVRTIPTVNWLDPRNRTTFDFNSAYGSVTQPGTVGTKTDILHGDGEHDWYFSPRYYALIDTSLDHNYSQGLSVQMIYGAGLGRTLIKRPNEELDVKFDFHYEQQRFSTTPGIVPPPPPTPSRNLVGADLGDTYMLKLPHGLVFNQGLMVTPAFNQPNAFSAMATAGLTFPVYKRLAFTVGSLDNFLNDPATGSKKNSFQFTAGATYDFK